MCCAEVRRPRIAFADRGWKALVLWRSGRSWRPFVESAFRAVVGLGLRLCADRHFGQSRRLALVDLVDIDVLAFQLSKDGVRHKAQYVGICTRPAPPW